MSPPKETSKAPTDHKPRKSYKKTEKQPKIIFKFFSEFQEYEDRKLNMV
jgi:hypothetical protein